MLGLTDEQEGDQVAEFDQLCEVQSDKASVEITSQYEGTVRRLLHTEGDVVQVRICLFTLFTLVKCIALVAAFNSKPCKAFLHTLAYPHCTRRQRYGAPSC